MGSACCKNEKLHELHVTTEDPEGTRGYRTIQQKDASQMLDERAAAAIISSFHADENQASRKKSTSQPRDRGRGNLRGTRKLKQGSFNRNRAPNQQKRSAGPANPAYGPAGPKRKYGNPNPNPNLGSNQNVNANANVNVNVVGTTYPHTEIEESVESDNEEDCSPEERNCSNPPTRGHKLVPILIYCRPRSRSHLRCKAQRPPNELVKHANPKYNYVKSRYMDGLHALEGKGEQLVNYTTSLPAKSSSEQATLLSARPTKTTYRANETEGSPSREDKEINIIMNKHTQLKKAHIQATTLSHVSNRPT